jgi:predicted HAD superfamily phosphohydrolase
MKQLVAVALTFFLVACHHQVKTEYKDRYVPIILVPPPPQLMVPEYYAHELTDEQMQSIGEVTKAYVVSTQQAMNYIDNLKSVYDLYLKLSEDSTRRIQQLIDMGVEVDRSLLEQANIEIQEQLEELERALEFENELHSLEMQERLREFE